MIVTRETLSDFERASHLEWLETNGTGAFAMGTLAGVNTRRYHALLVSSLRPPVERNVLLSRVEEEVVVDGTSHALGVCQYPGVALHGCVWLDEFRSEPCATWRFSINGAHMDAGTADGLNMDAGTADGVNVEKQVYLVDGRQAVVIRYRSDRALTLRVRPFLAYRDYHSLGHARPDVYGGLPRIEFHHDGAFEDHGDWYFNIEYLREQERGLDFREDLYTPGVIVLELQPGEWSPICASIDDTGYSAPTPRAEPFVVKRADGRPTILAGYPWFTDWGRDTMISLPGLLIAKGRLAEARAIIEGFLAHMQQGVIPNRFPDAGELPEYNTADATLWMFQCVRHWRAAGGNRTFLRDTFYPAAKDIIDWHMRGTWYGIGVDPEDHLLRAGVPGTQLTWMDAKVGDWVVTPRHGKAVEINALWHGALRLATEWAEELGDPAAADYRAEADHVRNSFRAKFWNASRECLYDVLHDEGADGKVRPNQIFAVSLPFALLERDQQQAVVRIVERELLTRAGLRTLERSDAEYKPHYVGSPVERDGAYHQGTVWPWLMGAFVDAYLAAFGRSDGARLYCAQLIESVEQHALLGACPDSIGEIYDGDDPHTPRGCPAQAWSVAEIARAKAAIATDAYVTK
jgi:glycogen debranching enzyme